MSVKKHTDTVVCAGIALVHDGRIFLVRPSYNFTPQKYAIPKGHQESGESLKETAVREFKEETGIDIDKNNIEYLTTVYTKLGKNSVKKVVVYFTNGNGSEKFLKSTISQSGSPENLYGEYMDFSEAKKLITGYQNPIIDKLMELEVSSFGDFLNKKLENVCYEKHNIINNTICDGCSLWL